MKILLIIAEITKMLSKVTNNLRNDNFICIDLSYKCDIKIATKKTNVCVICLSGAGGGKGGCINEKWGFSILKNVCKQYVIEKIRFKRADLPFANSPL